LIITQTKIENCSLKICLAMPTVGLGLFQLRPSKEISLSLVPPPFSSKSGLRSFSLLFKRERARELLTFQALKNKEDSLARDLEAAQCHCLQDKSFFFFF